MPNVLYGFLRFEAVANAPNSILFSGLVINNGFVTQNFTLTIAFTGGSSFSTSQFSLPKGEAAAFSFLLTGVQFAVGHTGSLTLQGTSNSETTNFTSDPATIVLGFQFMIVGHPMPDLPSDKLPSQAYTMMEEHFP